MKEESFYWVPFRVRGKGSSWIKMGPYRTREQALGARQEAKDPDCEVDIYWFRTATEMDAMLETRNGGSKQRPHD